LRTNTAVGGDGHTYSTLADVPVFSATRIHQSGWIELPRGWQVAPDTADSRHIAAAFGWSSGVLVVGSGGAVCVNGTDVVPANAVNMTLNKNLNGAQGVALTIAVIRMCFESRVV